MTGWIKLLIEVLLLSGLFVNVFKAVYCHPAYLTFMQSTSWETLDWKKHKLESRLLGEMEYYLVLKRTTLSSHEKDKEETYMHITNFSQSDKPISMISTIWHSGKKKIIMAIKRSVLAGGGEPVLEEERCSRAQEPQLLKPVCPRACALQQEKSMRSSLCTATKSRPCSPN